MGMIYRTSRIWPTCYAPSIPWTRLERIRFLTSHPRDMTQRILDAVAELPKACEHLNLPFQAGADEVLERMRRPYKIADYLELIERARKDDPLRSHQHGRHRGLLRRDR